MKAENINLFPFYRNDITEARKGVLHSPVLRLPHFQIFIAAAGAGPSVTTFRIRNNATGAFVTQSTALIETTNVSAPVSGTFYTYEGGTLTNALTPNVTQQVELVMSNGRRFYSHAFCPSHVFEVSPPGAINFVSCNVPSGGNYTFTFAADIPNGAGYSILLADENSSARTYVDKNFTITQAFATPVVGGVAILMTLSITLQLPNGGEIAQTLVRRLVFSTSNPCGTYTLTTQSNNTTWDEDVFFLEIDNGGADIAPLNQMYQRGFIQQLFFVGHQQAPTPVINEVYNERSNGQPAFGGATFRQQLNIDFFPVPDALALSIPALRYARGVRLTSRHQNIQYNPERFNLAIIEIEGEDVSAGTLQVEFDSARIDRCESNYTLSTP
jgi:hypothetical protein